MSFDHLKQLHKVKSKTSAIGDIPSPLRDELRDLDIARMAYSIIPYQPFFEGGDASLKFFERMRTLSPTHGSCIETISKYVLGGEIEITNRKLPGLAQTDAEKLPVSDSERNAYIEFIQRFTDFQQLHSQLAKIYDNYKTYGNAFIEIVMSEVAGERSVKFHVHDADTCRYLLTDPNEPRIVLISPLWTTSYIIRNTPNSVPLYPNQTVDANGSRRTIIHLTNDVVGRDWYGLPDSIMGLYFIYLEYQQGRFTVDGYANDWIPRVFFELCEDLEGDSDSLASDSTDEFEEALLNTFTNRGSDKKSVMYRVRAPGSSEKTEVHEFAANTNEKFHQAMGDIAESQVYKAHDWHPMLNQKTQGSLGNAGEFQQVFRLKFHTVIFPLQKTILAPMQQALKLAEEWLGFQNPNGTTIGLTNIFANLLLDAPTDTTTNSNATK